MRKRSPIVCEEPAEGRLNEELAKATETVQ
jgi:hypothetical protein